MEMMSTHIPCSAGQAGCWDMEIISREQEIKNWEYSALRAKFVNHKNNLQISERS